MKLAANIPSKRGLTLKTVTFPESKSKLTSLGSKHTCTIKKLAFQIMHQDIEAYSIHLEKGFIDLRIKIKIEGSDCFSDIETSEMKPYDEVFFTHFKSFQNILIREFLLKKKTI